jgi:hypothetical protein
MQKSEETNGTVGGSPLLKMFIEPSAGFQILSDKPSFLGATLFVAVLSVALSLMIIETIGFERIIEQRINESGQLADLPLENKQEIIAGQSGDLMKYFTISAGGIASVAVIFLGGLYYWFSMNALGSKARFPHGVAIWAYSSIPPLILVILANVIVLAIKPLEELDFSADSATGLVKASPAVFLSSDTSPALVAFLSSLDLFSFIGWVFAVIGIKTIGKLSLGTSIGIVGLMALFGIAVRVVIAAAFG